MVEHSGCRRTTRCEPAHPVPIHRPGDLAAYKMGRVIRLRSIVVTAFAANRPGPTGLEHLVFEGDDPGHGLSGVREPRRFRPSQPPGAEHLGLPEVYVPVWVVLWCRASSLGWRHIATRCRAHGPVASRSRLTSVALSASTPRRRSRAVARRPSGITLRAGEWSN